MAQDYPDQPDHHRRAVRGRRPDRHGGAPHRRADERGRSASRSWCRTSAAPAARSAPARSRTPRRTATRCCCTISACRPRRRSIATCPTTRSTAFAPIGLVTDVPMTHHRAQGLRAERRSQELIDYVKANADTVTYANAGIGAASHLCGMLFMDAIDTQMTDRALPGHRPGDDRPPRRPGRPDVRPDHQHDRPDPGRRGQGLCGDDARAARRPARPADHDRRRAAGLRRSASGTGSTRPAGTPDADGRPSCRRRCRRRWPTRTSSRASPSSAPRRSPPRRRRRRRSQPKLAGQIELWKPMIEAAGVSPTDAATGSARQAARRPRGRRGSRRRETGMRSRSRSRTICSRA